MGCVVLLRMPIVLCMGLITLMLSSLCEQDTYAEANVEPVCNLTQGYEVESSMIQVQSVSFTSVDEIAVLVEKTIPTDNSVAKSAISIKWQRVLRVAEGCAIALAGLAIISLICGFHQAPPVAEPSKKEILPTSVSLMNLPMLSEGVEVSVEASDYVLVFPLYGQKRYALEIGRVSMLIDWEEIVDGRSLAEQVFSPQGMSHKEYNEVMSQFGREMRTHAYHVQMRKILANLLVGYHLGLDSQTFCPTGCDELFLQLSIPRNDQESTVQQFAEMQRYRMPIKRHKKSHAPKLFGRSHSDDVALHVASACSRTPTESVNVDLAKDSEGIEVHAYMEFVPENKKYYEDFRQIDFARLLKHQLDKIIDLDALTEQGVVTSHFFAHDWLQVNRLESEWGKLSTWHYLPARHYGDVVRSYFGEEVAWMSVWRKHYIHSLLLPALLGSFLSLGRILAMFWLPSSISVQTQLYHAGFMVAWMFIFNMMYDRQEARIRQRWGMDLWTQTPIVPGKYDSGSEGSPRIVLVKILADFLALGVLILSVAGTYFIQICQGLLLRNEFHWIWRYAAPAAIVFQITAIDQLWIIGSHWIVRHENHISKEQFHAAWVHRLFWPRLFNNMFPFIYTGLLKQYSSDSCPATELGCIPELQLQLQLYFAVRVMVVVASDCSLLMMERIRISAEMARERAANVSEGVSDGTLCSYTQVQAKMFRFSTERKIQDWTEALLNLSVVACFSVVLPSLSSIAVLAELLLLKLKAHRNLHYLQRPSPHYSAGIGVWREVLENIELLAMTTNLAFAIFAMQPMCDYSSTTKWVTFSVCQNVMYIIRKFIHAKFPREPSDVIQAAHHSKEVVRKLSSKLLVPSHNTSSLRTLHRPELTPDAAMTTIHEAYES